MVLASAAIESSGRNATRTAPATSRPLTSSATMLVTSKIRRSRWRAPVTRAVSMVRVSSAPSTRVGEFSVTVAALDQQSGRRGAAEGRPVAQHQVRPYAVGLGPVDDLLGTYPGPGQLPGQLHPAVQQGVQAAVGLCDEDRVDHHAEQQQHHAQHDDHRRGHPEPQRHRVELGRAARPSRARVTARRRAGTRARGRCARAGSAHRPRACGGARRRAPRPRSRRTRRSPRPRSGSGSC